MSFLLIRFISKKVLYHLSLDKPVVYDGSDLLWAWQDTGQSRCKTDSWHIIQGVQAHTHDCAQVCWCAATSVKGYGILKTSLTVSSCLWGVQIMARLNKGWKKWSKSVLLYWMWACTTFVTAWSLNVAWSVSNYTGTDWRFVTHLNVRNLCVHTYRFAGTYRCKTCRQLLFLLHYCRN